MKELYDNTILIVDDTTENIDILVGLLKDFNKKVAINGEIALEIAWKDATPDLILLDIMMPDMDGYEVCKRLREDNRTKDVPIIFLTAKATKEDVIQGFEVGGQDYITKPFDARELMERVKTQLELKTQREILKDMNNILEEKVSERTAQLRDAMVKLDYANKELQGLDKAKNNFLNMISHEIRTPLNGIVGATSFLNETLGADSELSEFVEMLQLSVNRLESFSTTALIITQLQTDYKLLKVKCNLAECISECVESNSDGATAKKVDINVAIEDESININADNSLIIRAINSLIDNAVKYSEQDSMVSVSLKTEHDNIILEVTDNGRCFSKDAINNLYKPFGLGEDHYDKNCGLGLKVTKHIMDAHGGDIEIENKESGGACVRLKFPL